MRAKLLIQQSPVTSEINLFFITDPTARVEDCLVTADLWQPLTWTTVEVDIGTLFGDNVKALKLLTNREFRAVTNSEPENSLVIALSTEREVEMASRHMDSVNKALSAHNHPL
jgi:hypothetical protein